jgi:hypothetical protein
MTQTTATGGNDWAVIEFLTSPNRFKPFEIVTVLNGRVLYEFKAKPWTGKLYIFDANELIIGSVSRKSIKIRQVKLPVYLTGGFNVSASIALDGEGYSVKLHGSNFKIKRKRDECIIARYENGHALLFRETFKSDLHLALISLIVFKLLSNQAS